MQTHGIQPIDLLVVNLYPFEATVTAARPSTNASRTSISVVRRSFAAPRKITPFVCVVVDPVDYEPLMQQMQQQGGGTTPDLRRRLAAKAFARTAAYDAAIASWFAAAGETFPSN